MVKKPSGPVIGPAGSVYSDYIGNCRRRNIYWEITREQLAELIKQNCTYCKAPPRTNRRGVTYNGLDRIDHDRGYTLKNVLPCCGTCNSIRGRHLTVEEMKVAMKAIINYREGKNEVSQS